MCAQFEHVPIRHAHMCHRHHNRIPSLNGPLHFVVRSHQAYRGWLPKRSSGSKQRVAPLEQVPTESTFYMSAHALSLANLATRPFLLYFPYLLSLSILLGPASVRSQGFCHHPHYCLCVFIDKLARAVLFDTGITMRLLAKTKCATNLAALDDKITAYKWTD